MPWVSRPRGLSQLEFYRQQLPAESGQLLDLASYSRAGFGVLQDDQGVRRGLIVSHSWDPRPGVAHNFGYYLKSEAQVTGITDGPLYRAPERILQQLSPLEECGYERPSQLARARRWREASHQWNQRQAAKPHPRPGQLVVFRKPYRMEGGVPVDTFEFLGRSDFRVYGDPSGQTWRLQSWRRREYRVMDPPGAGDEALQQLLRD